MLKRIRAASLIRKGIRQQNRGDVAGAIATFTKAIELLPDSEMGYYRRARAHWQQKNYDAALADYAEVIRINPVSPDAYQERAGLHQLIGNKTSELEDYAKALEVAPQQIDRIYTRLSEILDESGDFEGAVSHIHEAVEANPRNAQARLQRAKLYIRQNQVEKALQDALYVLKFAPRYDAAYQVCGMCYTRQGNFDKAIESYKNATKYNPQNYSGYIGLGNSYFCTGNYPQAKDSYEAALFHQSASQAAIAGLALAYYRLNDIDTARRLWQNLIRTDEQFRNEARVGEQLNWHPILIEAAHELIQDIE